MTCDHVLENIEHSFYRLLVERVQSDVNLCNQLNSFIVGMGKSLVDFQNRYPGGPPQPDRKVNLPKRDSRSRLISPQRNIR